MFDCASLNLCARYQLIFGSDRMCHRPCTGSEFSFALLLLLGLLWLATFALFPVTSSPALSSSCLVAADFFGLSAVLVANDNLVCWVGAGLEPSGLPKNLLYGSGQRVSHWTRRKTSCDV